MPLEQRSTVLVLQPRSSAVPEPVATPAPAAIPEPAAIPPAPILTFAPSLVHVEPPLPPPAASSPRTQYFTHGCYAAVLPGTPKLRAPAVGFDAPPRSRVWSQSAGSGAR